MYEHKKTEDERLMLIYICRRCEVLQARLAKFRFLCLFFYLFFFNIVNFHMYKSRKTLKKKIIYLFIFQLGFYNAVSMENFPSARIKFRFFFLNTSNKSRKTTNEIKSSFILLRLTEQGEFLDAYRVSNNNFYLFKASDKKMTIGMRINNE